MTLIMIPSITVVATSLCVFCAFFYIWAKWKLSYWQRRGVPTLPTNIFFGNFAESIYGRISAGYLLGKLHNQADPDLKFLGVYIFQKPVFLVRDPTLIRQILIKDFSIFSNRYFSVESDNDQIGTKNLFSVNNPRWQHMRHKLSPAFSTAKLKGLFKLMVESSHSLTNYLEKQFTDPRGIKIIDVEDASTRFITDIIASLAFGINTNSFEESTQEFYTRSRELFRTDTLTNILTFCVFFFPRLANLYPLGILGKQEAYIRNIFWASMNAREQAQFHRGDIMDNLLKLKNEKQDSDLKFQGDVLVAQSVIFFVAGSATSSETMAFTLNELAKRPDIQDRVRQEIIDILDGDELTYEKVQQMKYLHQVINETLRLYPLAPIIDRVAEEDYKVPDSNVTIEKGTPVYVALRGVHMDTKYFSDPEKYDPDRFDENNKIEPYTYLPFGEGPRICIGMRIGMMQTAVGLITMLKNYRFSIDPSHENRVHKQAIFIAPENGVHLRVEKL
ncbi:cytochrome P450 6k1-like [Diachasmimorpha longicaudata]|uniref:cytochrome P450 6k1-like n=1 Tax=Diachasmimorpha longicaudata TaxID=58733 RepID=UPI0030B8CE0F